MEQARIRTVQYMPHSGTPIALSIRSTLRKKTSALDMLVLRPIRFDDTDRVFRFRTELYNENRFSENYSILHSPPSRGDCASLTIEMAKSVEGRTGISLVAEVDDKIEGIGYVAAQFKHLRWPYLTIFITKDYRSMGLGKRMMGELIEGSRQHFDQLWLSVHPRNHVARALYIKLGFQPMDKSPDGKMYEHMRLILRRAGA